MKRTVNDAKFAFSDIDLFRGLSGSDLEALAKRCRWRRYSSGQLIIGHQDESNDVFFIAEGLVRVTVYSGSGKEVSFRDLGAGKSIGELSAVDGAPRSANVIALTDSVLAFHIRRGIPRDPARSSRSFRGNDGVSGWPGAQTVGPRRRV